MRLLDVRGSTRRCFPLSPLSLPQSVYSCLPVSPHLQSSLTARPKGCISPHTKGRWAVMCSLSYKECAPSSGARLTHYWCLPQPSPRNAGSKSPQVEMTSPELCGISKGFVFLRSRLLRSRDWYWPLKSSGYQATGTHLFKLVGCCCCCYSGIEDALRTSQTEDLRL